MKIFQCGNCHHPLFFENYKCESCGHLSGYFDGDSMMLTFNPSRELLISDRESIEYKYCNNQDYGVCNWLLKKSDPNQFCSACQLNRTIPNLTDKKNFSKWKKLERAKHRLIYQLHRIGLPLSSKLVYKNGLCFDFIAKQDNLQIMTGHADGVITILLKEADSVLREQMRKLMSEPYRTIIGHLRHEVGHYFWDQLVFNNQDVLTQFRALFGDEQANYSDALKIYYKKGAPKNWGKSFISKYATSHPWEDWAETWAHYLHIMDMVETAHFFGLKMSPPEVLKDLKTKSTFDPYTQKDFNAIIDVCMPLSFAVNSFNRAMGIPDVYPFVISLPVVKKMVFIHNLLNRDEKVD